MSFSIECRAGIKVLVYADNGGCRPATDEESESWAAIAALTRFVDEWRDRFGFLAVKNDSRSIESIDEVACILNEKRDKAKERVKELEGELAEWRNSRDGIMAENERLAFEWQQAHDCNNQLITERFSLKKEVRKLTAERDRLRVSVIKLSPAEIQSGVNRVKFAEGLIQQLPNTHEGRNTWLMNYGVKEEAVELRRAKKIGMAERGDRMPFKWSDDTQCLISGTTAPAEK